MNEYERQQRENNEAFRKEAEERLRAQQQEQHRRAMKRIMEDQRLPQQQNQPSQPNNDIPRTDGGSSPVVWFFGFMGAVLGGMYRPSSMYWGFGAFFGFVIAGVASGYMSKSPRGRSILTVVGLVFAALVVAFIVLVFMTKDK